MEITKYFRLIFSLGVALLIAATPLSALAQTYGQSTYGACDFGATGTSSCTSGGGTSGGGTSGGGTSGGGSSINLGPVSLPITGPGAWTTWATLALILAAILFYWGVTHRKRRLKTASPAAKPDEL